VDAASGVTAATESDTKSLIESDCYFLIGYGKDDDGGSGDNDDGGSINEWDGSKLRAVTRTFDPPRFDRRRAWLSD
jgi:hypothetical protein